KDERASLFLTEADNALGRERAAASSDDLGAMCDRLAGDLLDPHKRAPGVPFDAIDAEKAIPACQTAVEEAADEPRFRYQLGRALNRAGKREEAAALIRAVGRGTGGLSRRPGCSQSSKRKRQRHREGRSQ